MQARNKTSIVQRGRGGHPEPKECGAGKAAEMIVSSLKDGIIFLDNSGLVSSINPVMEDLLGIGAADAVGRSVKEITGAPEICLLITLKASRSSDTFKFKGLEFEVEGIEVFDEDGERAGTVTLFHDVTEVRMLERQRAEVMSMITHDLKAPLTAVLGHADLVLDGSLGSVSPEVRDSVEAMARGGQKVLDVIDDYLTISRLEAGQMQPFMERTDVAEVAREAVEAARPDAEARGRSLELEVGPGLTRVACDPAQVERVISNLVNNAVKFTLKGGSVRVGVNTADPSRVRELAGDWKPPGPGCVEIYVEDDGVGIPLVEQANLFDRYWRGAGAGSVKGSGLGLAIVKHIVDAHRGVVGVKSEKGKGSRFHVLLPADRMVPNKEL